MDDTFTLESLNNSMLEAPPKEQGKWNPKYKKFYTALSKKSLEGDEDSRMQQLTYGDKIIGFKIESSCSENEGATTKKKEKLRSQID